MSVNLGPATVQPDSSYNWTADQLIADDKLLQFGTTADSVLLNRSSTLNAATTLTGVIEGTPETLATAANSLIIANQTNDGDIHLIASKAGTSFTGMLIDGSAGDTILHAATGGSVDIYVASTKIWDISATQITAGAGQIIASGATNGNTLLLRANDTTFLTFATGATDSLTLNQNLTVDSGITVDGVDVGAHAINFGLHTKLVRKTAAETVNNSTTFQNDDDLLFAVAANEVWAFICHLSYTSGQTPDFKYQFTVPSGAIIDSTALNFSTALGLAFDNPTDSYAVSAGGRDATVVGLFILGTVTNSTNAGNVQLQWAQNVAEASNTIVRINSYILAWQLA